MDTSAVDNLEFNGEDSEECNKFISAVLKYAYAQGKWGDDEWVAAFAATCFRGDALRWWTGLNPQTQESWKQLRHAMAQHYRPSFYGRSGEEAEQFVHLVYKRALDAGRHGDNQWIVNFVVACFKGAALRWYSSLDPTIQNDWRLLQEAIFRQYPPDDADALQRTTPTPAAAVVSAYLGKPLKKGRVRVVRQSLKGTHYLARTLDHDGNLVYTQSANDALQVEYDPNRDGPQDVIIPDSQVGQYDLLAISFFHQKNTSRSCAGILCVLDSKMSKSSARSSYPHLKSQWKIVHDSASSASEHTTIIPVTDAGQLNIFITDQAIYFYYAPLSEMASLVFEPL